MMNFSFHKFTVSANATTAPTARKRKGFVIVEVIVAMVLLAVAVTSLAALMYSVSQKGMVAAGNAYRNGVLMNEVNRLEGIPYSVIAVGTTTVSVTTGPYPHNRVITVTEPVVNSVKAIKVVITPTNVNLRPDTVSFLRTNPRTSKVLCTTCTS
jgi:prepilin-type N-terminal cleavage/methylation domain-containing protein